MFVDVLFSFQRTSHHLVLATLLVYHVQLWLSNIFLFFSKLFIVSFNPSFLMTLLVYHACRLLSNSFLKISLVFPKLLFHLLNEGLHQKRCLTLFNWEIIYLTGIYNNKIFHLILYYLIIRSDLLSRTNFGIEP